MRVGVLVEYLQHAPMSPSRRALDVAHALAARGHEVTLCADGADDASDAAPLPVVVRDPHRNVRQLSPGRFARWARSLRDRLALDRVVSLTWLHAGDAWAPVGPPTLPMMVSLVRRQRAPAPVAMVLLARLWAPEAAWIERGQRRVAHPLAWPAASALPEFSDERRAGAHARVRAVLGVPEASALVVCSAAHGERPGLAGALRGLASACLIARPVVALLGFNTWRLRTLADRAGCGADVRTLGVSWSAPELLAGADLALAPQRATGRWEMGRFIADAVRCGTPVLAHRGAPGAGVLGAAGEVVDADDAWRAAWERVLGGRLAALAEAARRSSSAFALDAAIDRLEHALHQKASTPPSGA